MKRLKPLESMIFPIHTHKVIIDADPAALYNVPTKALNQADKRNADRSPRDFIFRLSAKERLELVTHCDQLARLKCSRTVPMAFTEHGAIRAATVLNSPQAVSMNAFVEPPRDSTARRIGFQSKAKA
ncbi:MAG: ORF6N domain-containing protein [Nitrospira sp.]